MRLFVDGEDGLEPVRGLQLEPLLNDEENPVDAEKRAAPAARTGLIPDVA
ncbi:hypothetical protein ACH4F6_30995 [Streptomyces sp. NPDC017936]